MKPINKLVEIHEKALELLSKMEVQSTICKQYRDLLKNKNLNTIFRKVWQENLERGTKKFSVLQIQYEELMKTIK